MTRPTTWELRPGDILQVDGEPLPVIFLEFDRRNDFIHYKQPFGWAVSRPAEEVRYTILYQAGKDMEAKHGLVP